MFIGERAGKESADGVEIGSVGRVFERARPLSIELASGVIKHSLSLLDALFRPCPCLCVGSWANLVDLSLSLRNPSNSLHPSAASSGWNEHDKVCTGDAAREG